LKGKRVSTGSPGGATEVMAFRVIEAAGLDKDNSIAEVWNLIVTGDKMSNDDAYAIVKTLVEKKADIVAVHKEAESFSLDNQIQIRSPIPFHPGALKYFKEKGVGG
ncbi:MAG: C4-dicarboxylate transporter substrate-binding protein, partial [Tardiphaga sp.]|nr:C4-dicarboxylate transporter substrate-binding protein [Tardiphaga sp.]